MKKEDFKLGMRFLYRRAWGTIMPYYEATVEDLAENYVKISGQGWLSFKDTYYFELLEILPEKKGESND